MSEYGKNCARAIVAALMVVAAPLCALGGTPDAWLDGVLGFAPGTFAGFGADALPAVVLGRPHGGGLVQGSTHVVSLGHGGSITVVFRDNVVVDGEGDDLVIFENAFHAGSEEGPIFTEYGIVEVSPDGITWSQFPYDAGTGEGLAGRTPVLSVPDDGLDPLAPEAGGDRFDIGALGLAVVRFVRITDGGDAIPDAGNQAVPADKGGFDLDAMGGIHWSPPGIVSGSVTAAAQPIARARVRLVPSDGTRTLRKRTRENGRFRFRPVLPSGGYTLFAVSPAIGTAQQHVEVTLESLFVEADLSLE